MQATSWYSILKLIQYFITHWFLRANSLRSVWLSTLQNPLELPLWTKGLFSCHFSFNRHFIGLWRAKWQDSKDLADGHAVFDPKTLYLQLWRPPDMTWKMFHITMPEIALLVLPFFFWSLLLYWQHCNTEHLRLFDFEIEFFYEASTIIKNKIGLNLMIIDDLWLTLKI